MPYKDPVVARQKKKEYYEKNKDRLKIYTDSQRERIRNRDNRRRWKRKQEMVDLLGGVCVDCNLQHPLPCYDFHHLDPSTKEFDPCSRLTWKREQLVEELKKCVLLCANCHRIRHFNEASIGEK